MSPISEDPVKRARQLANLKRGNPAPPANDRTVSHGGYAEIARAELEGRERELFEALAADAPVRDADGSLPASDALVVSLLAEATIRRERVKDYLGRRGHERDDGELRTGAIELEAKLRREAFEYAEALGMSTRAKVRFGLDLARAQSAADEAEQRAARERLDARWDAIESEADEASGSGDE